MCPISTSNCEEIMNETIKDFAVALLNKLEAPVTPKTIAFISAWCQQEGTKAVNNPMATKYSHGMKGISNFSSVGVKNYATFDQGVEATANTLKLHYYPQILKAIRSGNPELSISAKSEWKTYIGDGDYSQKLLVGMRKILGVSGSYLDTAVADITRVAGSVNNFIHNTPVTITPGSGTDEEEHLNPKLSFINQASSSRNFQKQVDDLYKACVTNTKPETLRKAINKLMS